MGEISLDAILATLEKQKDNSGGISFARRIVRILKENGIELRGAVERNHSDNPLASSWSIAFDSLDFSEHDKDFLEEIEKLKAENAELHCELQAMQVFPNKLPYEPIEVAQMLITAIAKYSDADETYNIYDVSDLRQIAEHLLVYCNNNKDEE